MATMSGDDKFAMRLTADVQQAHRKLAFDVAMNAKITDPRGKIASGHTGNIVNVLHKDKDSFRETVRRVTKHTTV
jgi:hypothetical protein